MQKRYIFGIYRLKAIAGSSLAVWVTMALFSAQLFFSGCVRNRDFIYLQSPDSLAGQRYSYAALPQYQIQYNDILRITIKSRDPVSSELFNLYSGMNLNMMQANAQSGDPFYMIGYSVDDSGMVSLPIIGKIRVRGMTLDEARNSIQTGVDQYFNGAYVAVHLGGIRFSILGEVNRPGKYTVLQDRLTIFEAIAQGGDLGAMANRHQVTIIRQKPEGAEVVQVDLTQRAIFNSPYYFVSPNDVIYAQPLKVRELGTGVTAQQTLQSVVLSLTLLVNTILLYERLFK
jgi:polysaccharide export outer membrane protein